MTSTCGGRPGEPGWMPGIDLNEVGPPLSRCPECDRSIPPVGRSAPLEMSECVHRDVWPTRSSLWPGETRVAFGFPKCTGCPDCDPCEGCGGTAIQEHDPGDVTTSGACLDCNGTGKRKEK
jgi:hypothetical protein